MARIELDEKEQKAIESSVMEIRKILKKRNADLTGIVGTVSLEKVKSTKDAIEVRFEEDVDLMVQMNMVAFD